MDCYHAPIGYHRCTDHSNDIGIQCQGKYYLSVKLHLLIDVTIQA